MMIVTLSNTQNVTLGYSKLPFQGELVIRLTPQDVALGYDKLPFQGDGAMTNIISMVFSHSCF